jgi:1-acyl-sn-glycerol-3-phosphate acyltransferase
VHNLNLIWRFIATVTAFVFFGLAGLISGLIYFPIIIILPIKKTSKINMARDAISLLFRFFVYYMKYTGLLTYEMNGFDKIKTKQNLLIIANHPTLIDAVFIVGFTHRLNCIVKWQVWRNPVMHIAVKTAGYIHNNFAAEEFLEKCADSLKSGDGLIIFPEGARTEPGCDVRLKRSAAQIAIMADMNFTPIIIECEPHVLSRHHKWYYVPDKKPHFKLTVCNKIEIDRYRGIHRSIAARKITGLLKEFYKRD